MSFNKKHRFIAGAVCPGCAAIDKLIVYSVEHKDYRECVVCGYREQMHFQPVARELDTRVNQTDEKLSKETQVLEFLPMEKNSGEGKLE